MTRQEAHNYADLDFRVKAKTGQFVYHLTRKSKRASILEHGLVSSLSRGGRDQYNMVFAHNSNIVRESWYWIALDIWEWSFWDYQARKIDFKTPRDCFRYFVNKFYDIWRIDNTIAKKKWYIDFYRLDDQSEMETNLYVKSYGEIKKEALTLCCLDRETVDWRFKSGDTNYDILVNPIMPRDTFINKYGHLPEEEHQHNPFPMEVEHNVIDWIGHGHKREWRNMRKRLNNM